jgi:hypothetical protein
MGCEGCGVSGAYRLRMTQTRGPYRPNPEGPLYRLGPLLFLPQGYSAIPAPGLLGFLGVRVAGL